MKNLLIYSFLLLLSLQAAAEVADTSKVEPSPLTLSLELKSRHSWRGGLSTRSWNVQPTLEYAVLKNITLGAWGCYTTTNDYSEIDLYATYTAGPVCVTLYDYFNPTPNENAPNHHFFNFDKESTGHQIDATIDYSFESVPLKLMASTIVYGADLNQNGSNRYSTYFEASYLQKLKSGQTVSYFIGGTPHESMYYSNANIVNLGLKVSQDIMISRYKLPVSGSIIVNPARGNIYFIVSIRPF